MNNLFNKITGVELKSLRFLFFTVLISFSVYPQTKTNIDLFYSLIDSSSQKLISDLEPKQNLELNLNLGYYYTVFENRIRGNLLRSGFEFVTNAETENDFITVNFVIDEAKVEYSESWRDGLFGDFFTTRRLSLRGNYLISSDEKVKDFTYTYSDSVLTEDLEKIENRSYPFTQGIPPETPLFESLLEPVVAIGAAAAVIILFFSIRSK